MDENRITFRRRRPSIVWPVLLIGVGVTLLLGNLDQLPANSGLLLARLWPALLILAGIDIVVGRRSTAGWLFGGLLAVVVVGGLIALLVFAPDLPIMEQLTAAPEYQVADIEEPLDEVETADVEIDWGSGINSLNALDADSDTLISGSYGYYGDLVYTFNPSGSRATIRLDSRLFVIGVHIAFESPDRSLSLHPDVVYNLELNTGSGKNEFDLDELQLSRLEIDGGSGAIDLTLPGGDYRTSIDGGSGALTIHLPAGAAVRVDLDGGSGSFNSDSELELVRGDKDDGVYETDGFTDADQQIIIILDQGSGRVTIKFDQ